jgi:hypothetical protein
MRDRRLAIPNLVERVVVFLPASSSLVSIAGTPSSAHFIRLRYEGTAFPFGATRSVVPPESRPVFYFCGDERGTVCSALRDALLVSRQRKSTAVKKSNSAGTNHDQQLLLS